MMAEAQQPSSRQSSLNRGGMVMDGPQQAPQPLFRNMNNVNKAVVTPIGTSSGRRQREAPDFGAGSHRSARVSGEVLLTKLLSGELQKEKDSLTSALKQIDQDRSAVWLNQKNADTLEPGSLVRLRGFVQDMFDAEYYNYEQSMSSPSSMGCLTERTPVVITPIPCTTSWYREQCAEATNGAHHSRHYCNSHDGKFEYMEDVDENSCMMTDRQPKRLRRSTSSCSSTSRSNSPTVAETNSSLEVVRPIPTQLQSPQSSTLDHLLTNNNDVGNRYHMWPPGTMGSDPLQVPVMTKFYYDLYPHNSNGKGNQRTMVRMNQVVEILGVLDYQPCPQDQQELGQEDLAFRWEGARPTAMDWEQYEDGPSLLRSPSSVTSSSTNVATMPCIHVLSFETGLPLENHRMTNTFSKMGSSTNYPSPQACLSQVLGLSPSSSTGAANDDTSSLSKALYLALLSQAEREPVAAMDTESPALTGMPIITTAPPGSNAISTTTTLGCASLNVVASDVNAARSLYTRLAEVLTHVVPVLQTQEVTLESLSVPNGGSLSVGGVLSTAPSKNTLAGGCLRPHALQLPPGATLVLLNVDGRLAVPPSKMNNQVGTALQDLARVTSSHQLEYQFEGPMRLAFEADWRIIVISVPYTQNLLPCTLQAKYHHPTNASLRSPIAATAENAEAVAFLRMSLAKSRQPARRFCRMDLNDNQKCSTNIGLAPDLVDWAPKYFCQVREAARQRSQNQRPQVTEATFHQWLTWTRLLARYRGSSIAEVEDWKEAVSLQQALVSP